MSVNEPGKICIIKLLKYFTNIVNKQAKIKYTTDSFHKRSVENF